MFVLKKDTPFKNEELVVVNQTLFQHLKDHQIKGVKFMWEVSFKRNSYNGCILAHFMGTGKTLQAVTLAHTVLMNSICEVWEFFFVY
jgi:transcriptional regulator ATRX